MYNGGAISLRSHQQSITALSTSKAEHMALSDAAKEARSLLKLNFVLETNSQNNIKIYAKKYTNIVFEKLILTYDCVRFYVKRLFFDMKQAWT